jgi:AcrR family transcriptional regulator
MVSKMGEERRPNRKLERGQATRQELIDAALRLFAVHGYEDTSIEAVLGEAGVSRGALYHHFASKRDLFEAVYEAVETDTAHAIAAAARRARGDALRAGCVAWLKLAGDPATRQITLIDAPAVLGWESWSARDDRGGLDLLREALRAHARKGRLEPDLVDSLARVLLAALIELGLMIARAERPAEAQRQATAALDLLLARLLGAADG